MKKILSVVLIVPFAVLSLFSQPVLDASLFCPRPGDALSREEVVFKDPGRPGKSVFWDFSSLIPVEKKKIRLPESLDLSRIDFTKTDISQYFHEVSDAAAPVSYWASSSGYTVESSSGMLTHYSSSGDSLLVRAYENPTTSVSYSRPAVALRFPVSYKDHILSYYYGEGNYADALAITLRGSLESEADAYGRLILPGQDTLDNVLRIRLVDTSIDERTPHELKKLEKAKTKKEGEAEKQEKELLKEIEQALKKSIRLHIIETCRWYARGYRYPVFETRREYVEENGRSTNETLRAFLYSPASQRADYLDKDPANLALLDNLSQPNHSSPQGPNDNPLQVTAAIHYNFYPNPVTTDLSVEVSLPDDTPFNVSLYSLQGQLLYSTRCEKHNGLHTETVPMGNLLQGNYLLRINCSGETFTEKIVKN